MSSNIRINRVCQHCKKSFVARTTVTKYCGDPCAKKAYKARKRKQSIEQSQEETTIHREEIRKEILLKDFLNVDEVCTAFGISRTTLWRLAKNGRVRKADIGRRAIFLRDDLYRLFNITE